MKSNSRLSFLVFLTLGCVLCAGAVAQSGDRKAFKDAERALKTAMKSDELSKRRGAIIRVRSTQDERGVKTFLTYLHKARKNEAKLRKKLSPLQKKKNKYEQQEAERLARNIGKPKYAGEFEALFKNIEELTLEMRPIERDLRLEVGTKNALLTGIGDLVTALEEQLRGEKTNDFLALYEKVKKEEDRGVYLEILGHIHTPQSVAGLVGIASNDESPWMRAAALDALSNLGDTRGAKAAELGLKDDYWQVRVAAISSLNNFGSLDSIPLLIEQLEKEEGRLKGDVITALQLLTGANKHDNVTLWRRWWEENEKTLREIMKLLEKGAAVDVGTAVELIESRGFLLGARKVLDLRGLSDNAVKIEEARRSDPEEDGAAAPGGAAAGGFDGADEEETRILASIGRTIGARDEEIRAAAYEALLKRPLRRSQDPAKRVALIAITGHVGTEGSESRLVRMAGEETVEDEWRRHDKIAALEALGSAGHLKAIDALKEVFRRVSSKQDELLAATNALAQIAKRKTPRKVAQSATRVLIDSWDNVLNTSYNDVEDKSGLTKAIQNHLRSITEASADGYDAWAGWWQENKDTFLKGDDDLAAGDGEENPSGTSFYGIKTYSKRVAFVLDVSGSMNEPAEYEGGTKNKIEVAKEELTNAIAALPKDGYFNIIFYSTDYRLWQKTLVPSDADNKREAREWVAKVIADGNTNIYDPLIKAFQLAGRGTHDKEYEIELDTIFFLSDGQPNRGHVTDPRDILREVLELNSRKRVQIHTVGVGKGHNEGFMRALAEETGGTYISR